jgi:uncharacterized protein (DUF305 family)
MSAAEPVLARSGAGGGPAPDDGPADGEPSISDEAADRLYRFVFVGIGVAILVGGFFALARWATSADDPEPTFGPVDIGFMQDMLDHHDQALAISEAYLANNPDGDAAPYASEVVLFQTRDIGRMEAWLAEAGLSRGVPDRQAMTWMSEPSTVAEMPGMQDPARIAELEAARGAEADALFFELMTAHHLGGAHMADYAVEHAGTELIRDFAAAVSYNQRVEVVEYEGAVERLGLG